MSSILQLEKYLARGMPKIQIPFEYPAHISLDKELQPYTKSISATLLPTISASVATRAATFSPAKWHWAL